MNRLAVTARKIITPDTVILDGVVLVEGSKILEVGSRQKIHFTETEFQAANYNGDNEINILDIVQIINAILSE